MTTKMLPRPITRASSAAAKTKLRRGHVAADAQSKGAPADTLREGQRVCDTHPARALAQPLDGAKSPPKPGRRAPRQPLPTDQHRNDARTRTVRGDKLSDDQSAVDAQTTNVAAELLFCAEYLDDVERVRIATENRLRSMVEAGIDADPYMQQVFAFKRIEHEAVLALQRVVRRHPLGPWIKAQKGIGEKQGARLLAALGSVSYNHLEDRPRRGPSELWAYCGYVPGQKRRKGEKSNWNAAAKMRSFLIAESCIKQMDPPYRAVYDAARLSWADRDVKDGHKHNHALRLTAKAVLKDLFLEARRVGA